MANHKKVQKSTEIVNKKRPLEGVARNTYVAIFLRERMGGVVGEFDGGKGGVM